MNTSRICVLLCALVGFNIYAVNSHATSLEGSYSPIMFKSKKIAKWKLQSSFAQQPLEILVLGRGDLRYPNINSTRVSARRAFDFRFPQHFYASFDRTDTTQSFNINWQYLPQNIGTFTRLGWLLGDPETLNMAIEYEHRKVGSNESNALQLGVHYWF
jgi:hypothetical protein